MVDLKAKPFYLNDEQIKWVEDTIASLTMDEKIGQLFINLTTRRDPETLDTLINKYHIGGVRWQGGTLEEVYEQNTTFLRDSKVPTLIASNCEAGGSGAVREGTLVATGAACGASQTLETVRDMARVSAKEATAVGCNWTFAPICDIISNWRNTIVNTRAFGSDVEKVLACSKAYMEEMHKAGMACAAKHFPGDGSEERDQHLVMGCNDLSVEEWDRTFGHVYKELIDAGLDSIMIGHICQPAYSRKLRPGIKDEEIMPATLAPELLQDLLRGQLGFNGLIVTDASHMAGLTVSASRRKAVPGVIAAGCDMLLFFNDPEEDIQYMKEGLADGTISEERFSDALHRILGLKARLGLNRLVLPEKAGLSVVGCPAHHEAAARAADECITLVKDTQKALPLDPAKQKRVLLYYIESAPASMLDGVDPAKKLLVEELEKAGFEVDAPADFYELEMQGPSPMNRFRMMGKKSMEQVKRDYDLCLAVLHMRGYAQTNNNRVVYSTGHSPEVPWYVTELPTVCVSLNYTNHLIDVPMMKTFINAYAPTKEYIHALVQKLTGQSPFKGLHDELVWCDRWEARL
ncbi:MAG: glycosyl hydrolase [Clostridia bacterium]|nr:glycosyl hydrolase [Clostridia bacterium]